MEIWGDGGGGCEEEESFGVAKGGDGGKGEGGEERRLGGEDG